VAFLGVQALSGEIYQASRGYLGRPKSDAMFSDESRTLGITVMEVFFRRAGVLCGLRTKASPVGSRAVPPVTWLKVRRITLHGVGVDDREAAIFPKNC
jgi:hypothetical protein